MLYIIDIQCRVECRGPFFYALFYLIETRIIDYFMRHYMSALLSVRVSQSSFVLPSNPACAVLLDMPGYIAAAIDFSNPIAFTTSKYSRNRDTRPVYNMLGCLTLVSLPFSVISHVYIQSPPLGSVLHAVVNNVQLPCMYTLSQTHSGSNKLLLWYVLIIVVKLCMASVTYAA